MTGYFSRLLAHTGITAGDAGNDAPSEGSAYFQADAGVPTNAGDCIEIMDVETFAAPARETPVTDRAIRRSDAGRPDDRRTAVVPEPGGRYVEHVPPTTPEEEDRKPVRPESLPPAGGDRRPHRTDRVTEKPETNGAEDMQGTGGIAYPRRQDGRDMETTEIVPVRRPGRTRATNRGSIPAPERPATGPSARAPDRAGSSPPKISPAAADVPASIPVMEKPASKKAEPAVKAVETEGNPEAGPYRMKDVLEWVASGVPVEVTEERTTTLPGPAPARRSDDPPLGTVAPVASDGPAQSAVTGVAEREMDAEIRERDLRLSIGTISVTVEGPRAEDVQPVTRARQRKAETDEYSRVSRHYIRMR